MQKFLSYTPKDVRGVWFLGTNLDQIIKTLEYYEARKDGIKFSIPAASDITEIDSVEFDVVYSFGSTTQFFNAPLMDNVTLRVNANAFLEVSHYFKEPEEFRRGELYKFCPNEHALVFLPPAIVEAGKKYDWSQHRRQVNAWDAQRDEVMDRLRADGTIYKPQ